MQEEAEVEHSGLSDHTIAAGRVHDGQGSSHGRRRAIYSLVRHGEGVRHKNAHAVLTFPVCQRRSQEVEKDCPDRQKDTECESGVIAKAYGVGFSEPRVFGRRLVAGSRNQTLAHHHIY
jgi:hypothetical protein